MTDINRELFSDDLIKVLGYLETYVVKDFPTAKINLYYYTYAFLTFEECEAYNALSNCITTYNIQNIATMMQETIVSKSLKVLNPKLKVSYANDVIELFKNAEEFIKTSDTAGGKLTTYHVLLQLLSTTGFIPNIFLKVGVSQEVVTTKNESVDKYIKRITRQATDNVIGINGNNINIVNISKLLGPNPKTGLKKPVAKYETIDVFFTNLNKEYGRGKLDAVHYRESELEMVMNVLLKRSKNNVILTGEEGCGLTSIVNLLAGRIADMEVTPYLMDKEIIRLEFFKLIAGCSYKGAYEQRIIDVMRDLESSGKFIVFIDDIHIGLTGNSKDEFIMFLNVLLSNNSVQVIATIPEKEYKHAVERNAFIERKFDKLYIDKLSAKDTVDILKNNKIQYENYHNIVIPDTVIENCVKLCERYVTKKCLPSSVIEIIDMMCSSINARTVVADRFVEIRQMITDYLTIIESSTDNEDYRMADIYRNKIKKLNHESKELRDDMLKRNNSVCAAEEDMLNMISKVTKIPLQSLTKSDITTLRELPDKLREHVVGQDEAITKICKTLARNRLNLKTNVRRPDVFMFVGNSGVGKTLIAKKLCTVLFKDEDSLIRLDCGNYTEKHSVTNLIGSPRSYVGFDQSIPFLEKVKNNPYSVVLFDEIEKCAVEIYNVLLTIFDEGYLEDTSGTKVDFSNTIIILSSNVGTRLSNESNKLGFGITKEENTQYKEDVIRKELKKKFPPEFINRLNDIIMFNPLTDDNIKNIIQMNLDIFNSTLSKTDYNYSIKYVDDVINWLFKQLSDDDRKMGARPILKLIEKHVEIELTDLILENEYPTGNVFNLTVKNDKISLK